MEAIFISEIAIIVELIPANKVPYNNDTGPPFNKLNWKEILAASYIVCKIKLKLTIAVRLIYLCVNAR